MATSSFRPRRAIVDDLPQLVMLWELEQLPTESLEKRFTEFQVVTDGSGRVLAAVGLQVHGSHGVLHSEALAQAELGDELRELLWTRIQMVARNHNLDRIWSRLNYPFWRSLGFRPATPEELESLPEPLAEAEGAWNLLFLRDPSASADVIEKQFAMLRTVNAQETEKLQRRVAAIKKLALALTVVVTLLVLAWVFVLLRYGPQFLRRGQ